MDINSTITTTSATGAKRSLKMDEIEKPKKSKMDNLLNKSFHPAHTSTQLSAIIDSEDNSGTTGAVASEFNEDIAREFDMHPLDDLVMETPPAAASVEGTDTNSSNITPVQGGASNAAPLNLESMDTTTDSESMGLNVLDDNTPEDMDSTISFCEQRPITNLVETPVTGSDVTGWRESAFIKRKFAYGKQGDLKQVQLWNNCPLTYHQAVNEWRKHTFQVSLWKKIRDTFYQFNANSNMTGCFTVGEGNTYAAKVSVTDEMPRHVILSMGKNQHQDKDMLASGFYLPVDMVSKLLAAVKGVYDDIASGAVVSVKKLRLSTNQAKIVIRWGGNGKPLELYYSVPDDIKSIAIRNSTKEKMATIPNAGGSHNVLYTAKYHVSKEAVVRIACSEVNQFIESLKDVMGFINHLDTVLQQREHVLSSVIKKYASDKLAHHPKKAYYDSVIDAVHENQNENTEHRYPICILVPHIYNSYINEHYAL